MRFVLLNQFYPPEVLPTGVVLEAVADALVARGHQVTVLCGKTGKKSSVVRGKKIAKFGNRKIGKLGSWQSSGQEEQGAHEPPRVPSGAPPGDAALENPKALSPAISPAVQVVRLWAPGWGKRKSAVGKVLSYAAYYGGVAAWLLRHRWPAPGRSRADVIVALTSPPYLSLLARLGAWWHGGQHAHWVMDLYPDVMVAHGMLKERSLGHRLLGALARLGMGGPRCRKVITLGPDMAEQVQTWLPAEQTAVQVPLWGTAGESPAPTAVSALRGERGWEPGATVFLYSGNMGLGHRFTEVLQAFPQVQAGNPERKMHLAYFGGGKRQGEIREGIARMQGSPAGVAAPPASPASASSTLEVGRSALDVSHSYISLPRPLENSGGPSSTPAASFSADCRLTTEDSVSSSTFDVNTSTIPNSSLCSLPSAPCVPQENSAGASSPTSAPLAAETPVSESPASAPPAPAAAPPKGGTPTIPANGTLSPPRSLPLAPCVPPGTSSLHPYVPHDLLAAHLASGDVHLASLEPAWDGMMVPSKLQGIFTAGRPVLFTGSRTCSIGRWILDSGAGWVCAPGDIDAHAAAMQEALDPQERARRGAAAAAFAAQYFDQQTNVQQICQWLEGG